MNLKLFGGGWIAFIAGLAIMLGVKDPLVKRFGVAVFLGGIAAIIISLLGVGRQS